MTTDGCIDCSDKGISFMMWILILVITGFLGCSVLLCLLPNAVGIIEQDEVSVTANSNDAMTVPNENNDLQIVNVLPAVSQDTDFLKLNFEMALSMDLGKVNFCSAELFGSWLSSFGGLGKILIGYSQIMSCMDVNFSVPWPTAFISWLSGLAVLNLDVFQAISVDCMHSDYTFYDRLQGTFLCPIILGVAQGVICCFRKCGVDTTEEKKAVEDQHWKGSLFFLFLIYPSVSGTMLQTWHCIDVDGVEYLSADLRLTCDTSQHTQNANLAGLGFLLYIIGIPGFFILVLYMHKVITVTVSLYFTLHNIATQ